MRQDPKSGLLSKDLTIERANASQCVEVSRSYICHTGRAHMQGKRQDRQVGLFPSLFLTIQLAPRLNVRSTEAKKDLFSTLRAR
jgi:hypothetical protein